MRRSSMRWLTSFVAFAAVLMACSDAPPTTEVPAALVVALGDGLPGTLVRADAVTRTGAVWVALAEVAVGAPSLTLPAQLPAHVGALDPDVGALLCPGALSVPTPSAQPGRWAEVRELWLVDDGTLVALRRSSRPGLSLDDPTGYALGDLIDHWVYSDRSVALDGTCTYPGGVTRQLDLTIAAGWNALRTRVDAMAHGFPTALTTANAAATHVPWHTGEHVLDGVEALWAPSSLHHGPRGSWWGANQNKLVRSGDTLWLSVVHDAGAEPLARVVRRDGDSWHEVGAWPSRSPAQVVLVGGAPWLLVHEEDPVATSDTLGSIAMFDASGAALPHPTPSPRVNMRFGSTVTADDALVVAWGDLVFLPDMGVQREDLAFRTLDAASGSWSGFSATDLGVSYRYPYLVQDGARLVAAAAENTFVGAGLENRYHDLVLVQASLDGTFAFDLRVIDVAASFDGLPSPLPDRLVEVSDLTIDAYSDAHVLLKVFDGPSPASPPSLWHASSAAFVSADAVTASDDRPPDAPLPPAPAWSAWTRLDGLHCSWARFVTVPESPVPTLACAQQSSLTITTLDGSRWLRLRVPPGVDGPYLYAAEGRSGSTSAEPWIDLFLVAGSEGAYPNGPALVLSIDRAAVAASLQ